MLKVDTYMYLVFSYTFPIKGKVTHLDISPHFAKAQNRLSLGMLTGMVYNVFLRSNMISFSLILMW